MEPPGDERRLGPELQLKRFQAVLERLTAPPVYYLLSEVKFLPFEVCHSGGGNWYPGDTSSCVSNSQMKSGWNDKVSAIYIK